MGATLLSSFVALAAVLFQVIRTSDGCDPMPSCPEGMFIDDILCCCVSCPEGTYNDKKDQYHCMPCLTAHRTGSKSCQPWPSECNPRSSQWCARNNKCKANCKRGMYYDSKEKKCVQCPYGTYQYRQGTGCCQVLTCSSGKIPGPSRYNGVFPPLCVKKPEAPSLTLECCSDGTCNKTQVVRVPLTESCGMFNSALGDAVYGKDDYSPCHKVHYELPCPEGAVVIVQELQLAAGDSLVIDGVTLTGPIKIDLPNVFFLPPEDMNFTFTSDCYNQSRGFRIMYTCMNKEGRDYIRDEGLIDDCMVRACMKNATFSDYLLRIWKGENQLLEAPITCPITLLIGGYRRPVKDCSSCTPQCMDMGNKSIQQCYNVYRTFTASSEGAC